MKEKMFLVMGPSGSAKSSYCNFIADYKMYDYLDKLTSDGMTTSFPVYYHYCDMEKVIFTEDEENEDTQLERLNNFKKSKMVVKVILGEEGIQEKKINEEIDSGIENNSASMNSTKVIYEYAECLNEILGKFQIAKDKVKFDDNDSRTGAYFDLTLLANESDCGDITFTYKNGKKELDLPLDNNNSGFNIFQKLIKLTRGNDEKYLGHKFNNLISRIDIFVDYNLNKKKGIDFRFIYDGKEKLHRENIVFIDTKGLNDGQTKIEDIQLHIGDYFNQYGDKIDGVIYCVTTVGVSNNFLNYIETSIRKLTLKPIYIVTTKIDNKLFEYVKNAYSTKYWSNAISGDPNNKDYEKNAREILKIMKDDDVKFVEILSEKILDGQSQKNIINVLKSVIQSRKNPILRGILNTSLMKIYKFSSEILTENIKGIIGDELNRLRIESFIGLIDDHNRLMEPAYDEEILRMVKDNEFKIYINKIIKSAFDIASNGCNEINEENVIISDSFEGFNIKYNEALAWHPNTANTIKEREKLHELGYNYYYYHYGHYKFRDLSINSMLMIGTDKALVKIDLPEKLQKYAQIMNGLIKNVMKLFACVGCLPCIKGEKIHNNCIIKHKVGDKKCAHLNMYPPSWEVDRKAYAKMNKPCVYCDYSNKQNLTPGFCLSNNEFKCDSRYYCLWNTLKSFGCNHIGESYVAWENILDLDNNRYKNIYKNQKEAGLIESYDISDIIVDKFLRIADIYITSVMK